MKSGIYCPATQTKCDRPCVGDECQRVKRFTITERAPRPPDPDTKPILSPGQLRAARAYLDLTLAELAVKLDVAPQTLCYIERGVRNSHDDTLRRIINGLYDLGIEVFGTPTEARGIRDFIPEAKVAR